ncbi:hypothetical protein SEA_SIXAMA_55 [Gordonia phage Sixama]|uniref:Uncharacterized protein n=1 Tax=Gordonia phage Sixama TaxID=2653271 RepID=A0A5Q2F577_9CAUD|nr:hypothetical protein PP302_gp055 [Gordonia phage Sixama]QGF20234.1 hypothetical protein SEA_SIXAMA_55 [Gordonia phage Sixama]
MSDALATDDEFEYGIWRYPHPGKPTPSLTPNGFLWMDDMSKEQAERWMNDWISDGGRPGAFSIVRRPRGEWTKVN